LSTRFFGGAAERPRGGVSLTLLLPPPSRPPFSLSNQNQNDDANLQTTGAQLDAGDVKGAASTLQQGSGLVSDFEKAADAIAGPGKERAADVAAGVRALREAAGKGDAAGSKRQYVALVGALQGWADASGVAAEIKGL